MPGDQDLREGRAMVDPDGVAEYEEDVRREIQARIDAERLVLARRRQERENCACRSGMFPHPGRRGVLLAAGSTLAAGMSAYLWPAHAAERKAPAGAVWRDVPDDPIKIQG